MGARKVRMAALTTTTATTIAPAVGSAPTKAEYDALVTQVNLLTTNLNKVVTALKA